MQKLRIIIIDDEPIARERIKNFLQQETDIEIIGEGENGLEAVQLIEEKKPDLVLLDIQMPEMDGFGVIQSIGADLMPAVIFITAYDNFALKAFEVHALDYILKPFNNERFLEALNRARNKINNSQLNQLSTQFNSVLKTLQDGKKFLSRLAIKTGGRIYFIKTENVDWIESAGNYVLLYTKNEKHIYRETMKCLEMKLDPEKFVRIHRTQIVNIDNIKELQPQSHGEYTIILQSGKRLTLSRNYRDRLLDFFR